VIAEAIPGARHEIVEQADDINRLASAVPSIRWRFTERRLRLGASNQIP
jgi:hypothetical protein